MNKGSVKELSLLGFLALSCIFVVAGFAVLQIETLNETRVFGSYWASGQAWLQGGNPYRVLPLTWAVEIPGPDVLDVNLNPPTTLPLMGLFSLFPMNHAASAWIIFTVLVGICCCLFVRREAAVDDVKLAWVNRPGTAGGHLV